jgi:hypothetical protein
LLDTFHADFSPCNETPQKKGLPAARRYLRHTISRCTKSHACTIILLSRPRAPTKGPRTRVSTQEKSARFPRHCASVECNPPTLQVTELEEVRSYSHLVWTCTWLLAALSVHPSVRMPPPPCVLVPLLNVYVPLPHSQRLLAARVMGGTGARQGLRKQLTGLLLGGS